MNILIVRLGALGDIVHTIPAAAALRASYPASRIDWLVDARHRGILDLVQGLNDTIVLERPTLRGWVDVVRRLRRVHYDAALDFQGLLKSAVLARASGAAKVAGFSIWHLREKTARPFYSTTDAHQSAEDLPGHVIYKNLRLLRTVGIDTATIAFPLSRRPSAALEAIRSRLGAVPFALINPGAAWPNKRWSAQRFGEAASFLREVRGVPSVVLWGPGEESLARDVVSAAAGSAIEAPATTLADLVELSRVAEIMISGDTGPLHIAGAAGAPLVAIFGPTDPARNGPWSPDDVIVSRYGACECHYQRRCRAWSWCLADVTVAEVTAAIQQRLARPAGSTS
jgi:lipopolysaccharide heptosyltransferase I